MNVDGFENNKTEPDSFEDALPIAMKKLIGDDPAKIAFFDGFDASVPPAAELLEAFGADDAYEADAALGADGADYADDEFGADDEESDRRRPRRTRKFVWAASSIAAAVAVILFVTTVYPSGAFMGGGPVTTEQAAVVGSAEDSESAAAEEPAPEEGAAVADAGGVSEVRSAALPAPQSDYDDVYAAIEDAGGFMQFGAMAFERSVDAAGAMGPAASAEEAVEMPAESASPQPEAAAPATGESAEAGDGSVMPSAANETLAASEASAAIAAPEFSDTNIQTEGVQEADVVKTDGRYIYTANSEGIYITDANSGHPSVLSQIPQRPDDGQVTFEMYINGDTLTLIRQGYNNLHPEGDAENSAGNSAENAAEKEVQPSDECIAYPGERYMIDTAVDIYDVSDRAAPRKVRSLSQSGGYIDSRMIGDKLYLISNYSEFDYDAIDKDDPRTYVPLYSEGADQLTLPPGDIYIPPDAGYMSYTVVSGIDTSAAAFVSRESLLGESFTVYASPDNLYLSAMKYEYEEADEPGYYVTKNSDYTSVTRLSLHDGKVAVEASASVPGLIDDQFSLDEYGGTLRVVTTHTENVQAARRDDGSDPSYSETYYDENNESPDNNSNNASDKVKVTETREIEKKYGELEWEGSQYGFRNSRTTGLYVLDMNLRVLGKTDDLAPGEQVYSCRYRGNVAYFVTFRNTDPLFSVDLSDPEHPTVMGELKIPGFSDYLHPYADGLLFGLGFDADEETGEIRSVKVSMFDDSNPFDVTEKDTLVMDGFSYTEAAGNHKAILVDSRKSLIAFPADGDYVIMNYEQGKGFSRVMDVTLDASGDDTWYSGLRGIFIDDVFYVIAPDSIHTYDMADSFKPIGEASLGEGASYVDRYAFSLPPGVGNGNTYEIMPIEMID
ncbi:MAG: beta-propeller domain-containing protein [Clostridiales Family XIII bacterium]|jgi:uncharacterized secreted protein with C-terminal beta-propeller domain|nr:beta-propeller domain-containing protein [Clostridiales Family XIII bacterium]